MSNLAGKVFTVLGLAVLLPVVFVELALVVSALAVSVFAELTPAVSVFYFLRW